MCSKIMKISLKIENETSNWKTKEYFIQVTLLPFSFDFKIANIFLSQEIKM